MKSIPISILLASVILGISFIVGCLLLSNQGRASESTQAVEQDVPNNNDDPRNGGVSEYD